jgi:hypothetical protein
MINPERPVTLQEAQSFAQAMGQLAGEKGKDKGPQGPKEVIAEVEPEPDLRAIAENRLLSTHRFSCQN